MNKTMDHKRITLTPEVLLAIEEALNYPLFFGIPAGPTINEALIVALYNAKRVWNWRAKVIDYLRYRYRRFHQPSFGSKDLSYYKNRMIFTWLFDRSDLKALVLPLVEAYDFNQTVIVGPLTSMQTQLSNQTEFVLWDEFPKIDMKDWRREFDRCVPTWRHRLNEVLEKHSVPTYIAEFALTSLQIGTQRIMSANQFLNVVSPSIIVTEYDRNGHSSCLVLAARQRGIPAITMLHGALTPYPSYGYTPILSNYVCCWGELHKHNLMEHGVNQEQLIVTGCQSISRTIEAKNDSARLKIGLALDKPVVLLATSPIKLEDRKNYAVVFCTAMSRLPEITAIVRLHPAENITEYQDIINKFPNIKFLSNIAMSLDEALAATDIVVIHESSFGIDALLRGKLVVILDVLTTPLRIGKELIEIAGCPSIKDPDELELVVLKIFTKENFRNELHAKAEQYSEQYCNSYGQDAVNNVCRLIDHVIENRVNQ